MPMNVIRVSYATKLTTVLFVAIVLICGTAWFLSQGLRRSAAKKKFPVGMSMQETTGKLHQPYYISTNINSIEPYLIRADGDGLVLQFDRDEKLISVQLLTEAK
jgi:hypothetical protein